MARKIELRPQQETWNSNPPTSTTASDPRLFPGVSINGAPPLRASGDYQTNLVQIRCQCGAHIGQVFEQDPTSRGLPRFLFVESQVIGSIAGEPDARPIARLLGDDGFTVADCPAHGRALIALGDLQAAGRSVTAKLANGRKRVGRFIVKCSTPAAQAPVVQRSVARGCSIEEFDAWYAEQPGGRSPRVVD